MEAALIDWTRCFADVDPRDGYTKIYDMHTGDVIAVELTKRNGLTLYKTPEEVMLTPTVKCTPLFMQMVCSKIADGAVVKKLCESEDWMPSYAIFCRWSRDNEEFRAMLQQAEEARAENLTDEAVQVARDLVNKDHKKQVDVLATTLLVNQLWLKAGFDKPKKFQPKQKADVAPVSIQVVIETGIRRQGDPGFNVDETEKIRARVESKDQKEEVVIDVSPEKEG